MYLPEAVTVRHTLQDFGVDRLICVYLMSRQPETLEMEFNAVDR